MPYPVLTVFLRACKTRTPKLDDLLHSTPGSRELFPDEAATSRFAESGHLLAQADERGGQPREICIRDTRPGLRARSAAEPVHNPPVGFEAINRLDQAQGRDPLKIFEIATSVGVLASDVQRDGVHRPPQRAPSVWRAPVGVLRGRYP